MASDEAKPAGPVALRIKLRYDDVDAMVQRFACNVGRSGLFLPTRSLHPVGTEVKFELRIANDAAVLVGLGKVKAAKAPDPANPKAAFGLAIELMRVTRDGREIIIRMLERRRELALPEVAIPMPDDIEHARRVDVETQPGVPTPVARSESTPITQTTHDTQPRAPEPMPMRPTPPPESLLTAPRPASGPVGVVRGRSDRTPAPALAPEATRAKRPKLADLVAKAAELSGPVAAVELAGLDEPDVDVGKAIARARMLAGGEIDVELEALREASAAPIAIDVEAASAELARQLGGAPIARKDRSARWAPPPPAIAAIAPAVVPPEPDAPANDALDALDPGTEREPSQVRRLPTASGEMDQLAQEAAMAIAGHSGATARAIERPDVEPAAPEPIFAPEAIAVDAAPVPFLEAPSAPVVAPEDAPVPFALIAAEPIATPAVEEDPELSSFERALDAARVHTGVSAKAPAADEEIPELDSVDLEDEIEHTDVGAFAQGIEEPPAPATYDPFAHEHPSHAGDFEEEEISDLDVLAEADADDDDLLAANGERDSSGYPVITPSTYTDVVDTPLPPQSYHEQPTVKPGFPRDEFVQDVFTPPPEPSPFRALSPRDDFAARLALDEEDEPPLARYPAATFDDPQTDDEEDDDEANYTHAEDPDYENPELEFDERHDFGRRGFELAADAPDPVEELDNALSTLDVDLNKLEVPQAERRRPMPRARALPGMPPARASRVSDEPPVKQSTQPLPRMPARARRAETDDGVIIDFEDDDE